MKIVMIILTLSIVIDIIRVRKKYKKLLLLDQEINNQLEKIKNIKN